MANIEFKNITEYKKYLRTQHLTYLGEGSEAKCYVSNVDNLVYKNLLEETYIRNSYSADEVITKKQVNLPSFAFPIDLHTYQNTVWGYTSEFIFPDQFSEKSTVSRTKFLKINFNRLRKALELLKKDTEKISKENILIDDLPFNLIFTGTRLIAIDTLSYLRMTENTLKDNLNSIDYAITSVFDLWTENMGLERIREKDIDTYLKEVETLQNITKTTEKIIICGIICLGGIFMYNEDKESRRNKSKENDGLLSKFFRKRTKRLLTDLDKLFRKIMWIEIAISVVLILIGVVFLIWPSISVQVLSILFGIVILASGIMNIYGYMKRKSFPIFKFHLVYGILSVILGILTIINPFTFSQVVTIFIGVWMLYLAVVKIDLSLRLKTIGESSWSLLLVSAILEIFMSILIFINPFSNLVITQVAGAYFILSGILNCTDAVLTKNRAIDFMDNF